MVPVLTARTREELCAIEAFVHDAPFAMPDGIAAGDTKGRITISFGREDDPRIRRHWYEVLYNRRNVTLIEHHLVVDHIASLDLRDRARIACYTFNRLHFDERKKTLTVYACPALELRLAVDDLMVTIFRIGATWGVRHITTVCGCELQRLSE